MNDQATEAIEARALVASLMASKGLVAAEMLYRSIELAPNLDPPARATFENNRAGIAAMEASAMYWAAKLGMDVPDNPNATRLRRDMIRAMEILDGAISVLNEQILREMGGAS